MARMIKEEADRVKRELASKNNMVDISDNKVKLGSQAESVQNVNLSPQDIELLRRAFPDRIKYDLAVRELIKM